MADTTLRCGDPLTIEYTPASGNVAVGDVIVLGTITANTSGTGGLAVVAPRAITNNTLGEVSYTGGVYDAINLNNAANGAKVYWDVQNNTRKMTTVSTNNAPFGWVVSNGGGGANSICRVYHVPFHNNN